jgi:hypothetical protein
VKSDPRCYAYFQSLEIKVKAINRVRAEFRLIAHVKNGIRKEKRAVPHREEGTCIKQFLQLQDV